MDTQKMTEQLGASTYATTVNGLTGSITSMTDALGKGQNAWTAFRVSLGNTLKSLATEIETYIIKLLLVKGIKEALGWVSNSTGGVNATSVPGTSWSDNLLGNSKQGSIQEYIGGMFTKNAEGGYIPLSAGIAGVDSVPSLLMPGEVVIQKSSVDYYGASKLLALNDKKLSKFATGGMVGSSSGSGSSTDPNKEMTINIINVVDPRTVPKTTGSEILNVIAYDAIQNGPTFRTIKARLEQR